MGERDASRQGWGFETRAIHAGQPPDAATGAVVAPISLSTTFAQDAVGEHQGFEYARSGNPTRAALEACVASLEGAAHGFAFASGLAAEDNVLRLLAPGDRILLGNDAYGGTYRLIARVFGPVGYPWTHRRPHRSRRADWPADTRMVWLETPTNPLLTCIDIEAVADPRPRAWAPSSWSTTRSPRRSCRTRWPTAPTSSCTRPRSTSAATATSSAASSPSTTTTWPSASASPRTPPAPCRRRSTATSCCGA